MKREGSYPAYHPPIALAPATDVWPAPQHTGSRFDRSGPNNRCRPAWYGNSGKLAATSPAAGLRATWSLDQSGISSSLIRLASDSTLWGPTRRDTSLPRLRRESRHVAWEAVGCRAQHRQECGEGARSQGSQFPRVTLRPNRRKSEKSPSHAVYRIVCSSTNAVLALHHDLAI